MPRFAVFKVQRTGRTSSTARVDYQTLDDTATAPEDYEATNGTLVFDPGVTELEVRVKLRDEAYENDERFHLMLSNPVSGKLGRVVGDAVIPAEVVEDPFAGFPVRDLGVLFYAGESHPGGGNSSDSEWIVQVGESTQDDENGEATSNPFPGGYIGQFRLSAGSFYVRGGDGAIQTASGFYMHYVFVGGMFNIFFTDVDYISTDYSLSPANVDAFNTWWDANLANKSIAVYNRDDELMAVTGLPATAAELDADAPGQSGGIRYVTIQGMEWDTSDLGYVHRIAVS